MTTIDIGSCPHCGSIQRSYQKMTVAGTLPGRPDEQRELVKFDCGLRIRKMGHRQQEEVGLCMRSQEFADLRIRRQAFLNEIGELFESPKGEALDTAYISLVEESAARLNYQPSLLGDSALPSELADNAIKSMACPDGIVSIRRHGKWGNITWWKNEDKAATSVTIPWWAARLIADRLA